MVAQRPYEFQVLVRGRPCREYHHDDGRIFIEGRKKSEFTLRIKNNTAGRIMACMSVDGLSVMTGKDASVSDGGYIVQAHRYVDIPGWRLTDEQVAKFFFAGNHDGQGGSYATQLGKPTNVGVIGCAVYREKTYRTTKLSFTAANKRIGSRRKGPSVTRNYSGTTMDAAMDYSADVRSINTSCSLTPEKQHIGTGFGEASGHQVRSVRFENEPEPVARFTLFYDTKKGLRERGVDLSQKKVVATQDPWPGDRGCTPPPGWQG